MNTYCLKHTDIENKSSLKNPRWVEKRKIKTLNYSKESQQSLLNAVSSLIFKAYLCELFHARIKQD